MLLYRHRRIIKGTGGLENKRTGGDHLNYIIIENGQNTEKSLGDSRRLAVTQTPVEDHQLELMWNNNNNDNNNNWQGFIKDAISTIIVRKNNDSTATRYQEENKGVIL